MLDEMGKLDGQLDMMGRLDSQLDGMSRLDDQPYNTLITCSKFILYRKT